MKRIVDLKLRTKFGLLAGMCFLVTGAVAGLGVSNIYSVAGTSREMADVGIPRLTAASLLESGVREARLQGMHMTHSKSAVNRARAEEEMETAITHAEDALKAYRKDLTNPDEVKAINTYEDAWREMLRYLRDVQALKHDGKNAEAATLMMVEAEDHFDGTFLPASQNLIKVSAASNRIYSEQATSTAQRAVGLMLVILAVAGVAVAGLVFQMSRMVSVPLQVLREKLHSLESNCVASLQKGLKAINRADLTTRLAAKTTPTRVVREDEIGQLCASFDQLLLNVQSCVEEYNEATVGLSQIVSNVLRSSERVATTSVSVASASEQSSAASEEIAQGSTQLAGHAEEANRVVDNMFESIRHLSEGSQTQGKAIREADSQLVSAAQNISQVAESSEAMSQTARSGGSAVRDASGAMVEIRSRVAFASDRVLDLSGKSEQIGNIVNAIETIADQTNLLALNAAIEAARAGEHGRGFAVVADEVRKLAEQATSSTREISVLIEQVRDTVRETVAAVREADAQVELGSAKGQAAGTALDQIVHASEEVSRQVRLVSQMTTSAAEKMSNVRGVTEANERLVSGMNSDAARVSTTISNVAAVSQESAAGAEELSASVQEVSASAQDLNEMSQKLRDLVSQFQLREESSEAPNLRLAA